MLWFALYLSGLPLEAWLATADGSDPRPRCVVEARRVVRADAAAMALGVEVGMSAASAASLVGSAASAASLVSGELSSGGGLQVFTRSAAREAAQVQRLALSLARFTPSVVVQTDGVLLEVSASLRLFGGARALWRAVREAARASGVQALRMAAAPTATAAAVLARAEPASPALRRLDVHQRLDALPLPAAAQAWQIEPRLVELLHGVGCRTLGDVRVLPRSGAQRRGAAALLGAIARAHGDAPDPQAWFEPPRTFEMGLELLHRADDAAMLVFATQRLVQPLAGWLSQQWLAAARLSLVLRHETSIRHVRPDTVVTLSLGDPTRDAAQLMLLLRERLQRATLQAPVYAIVLRLDQSVNLAGREKALWREAGGSGHEDARALFDRLAARLGPERVMRPLLVADHRPERAMKLVPMQENISVRPDPSTSSGQGTPGGVSKGRAEPAEALSPTAARPTWLLPEPLRLQEDHAFGRPLHQGVPLVLASRAERIEAGWFDGALISRDYHVAQAKDQRWLWVFRERRGDTAHWYLHGVFG
jgi:protein ImuB